MSQPTSIFERHPRLTMGVFYLLLGGLLAWLFTLDMIPSLDGEERYSIADEIYYLNQARKARFIVLRERHPLTDRYSEAAVERGSNETRRFRLRTDKDGFIFPSAIHASPDLKIVFLGGSTTECEYVDEEERFPYLVGRQLERALNLKVNAYNAGRSGNNSLHSINILINKVLPLEPDVVVMMEAVNDLSTLVYDGSYWNYNKSRSHLIGMRKDRDQLHGYDEWADSTRRNQIFDPQEQHRIIELFRQNLELFIQITRTKGAIPVLMTQANDIESNPQFDTGRGVAFSHAYRALYTRFNEKTRETARRLQVPLIDLARQIPANAENLYDAVHLTSVGSRQAAAAISEVLISELNDDSAHEQSR